MYSAGWQMEIDAFGLRLLPAQYFLVGPDGINPRSRDSQRLRPWRFGIPGVDVPVNENYVTGQQGGWKERCDSRTKTDDPSARIQARPPVKARGKICAAVGPPNASRQSLPHGGPVGSNRRRTRAPAAPPTPEHPLRVRRLHLCMPVNKSAPGLRAAPTSFPLFAARADARG